MQKLQDSVFSIVKTTSLSPAVFSFLQPTDDFDDKTPLGGILKDTKHGWLALGPKFCVVDLRTGLKVAARIFSYMSNTHISVSSVVELPTPLTENSLQLVISLQCEDTGLICVLHVNGSQILRCIQTEVVVTELAVCDIVPDGPLTCFDGVIMAGTRSGEIFAFDLNRACLIQALKDISKGYEHLIQNESNPANLHFLPLNTLQHVEEQRELALDNDGHLAVLLNESSLVDNQYIFRNPDGSVRMKAKRDHIRVTVLQYIPQLGSLAVGFNFGAFQIWNLMNLDLEYTSQINVECLPVTHFGFQEPCDDPRAFCYLWVIFSVIDRFEEEEFPLAVMYSLTYQGKRMLSDVKCLYQEFSTATIRFQVELGAADGTILLGGKCVSCHTYSINSTLGAEGEDSMLNICQLVWECWGENANSSSQYGMLLFDLDQWYKDQMPATYSLQSNTFMSATWCREVSSSVTLAARLDPASVCVYSHATRLEEHFYPNSLQYNCIYLNTSESTILNTIGIQRQIISSLDEVGPTALLNPPRLYNACVAAGLTPLYMDTFGRNPSQEEQRQFLLSVALEARLSRFLKRCAHDWATGSHTGAGCTLTFLVDWCWKRAIDLKENARELTAPLFASSALPDRNVVRCLEHCVQQLTALTGLLDAVLTKCCNMVVPDALSEMEEKFKGIGTVALYFQVVQWFLRVGLLPERHGETYTALPYPTDQLNATYTKRRLKLNRLQDNAPPDDNDANKSCSLLYIDQLIEQEFGGDRIHQMWIKGGSECSGLYPPPSLYSLLRLYLLPDIAEEHKHSLVLYLLVDYSMVYDEVRYEAVIRRLMQFPTMFGLSNTAIKATQAFWHLDHRDFDFALDQLQCLTGNTLSEWQHNVVLSSLLAQKKTQAALQYLHVRKPAPIQNLMREKDGDISCYNKVNDHDKLDDWQSCCNLYLARGLVYEALDVIRMCVRNAGCVEDKVQVLNFFFKGCRNTGNLSKVLQIMLLPFEEEVFIRYLENCNESQTSDILIMYYLQHARYLEAQRYNIKLKQSKPRTKDISTSIESLVDVLDREGARDTIVEVVCSSIPSIANTVARFALDEKDLETHVIAPKPMSVYVQAKSPKNTFTYKSSFIQDTIENASETWMNKPKTRRGIKRALNIEDTPFICTPKLSRTKSVFSHQSPSQSTPPKRSRLDVSCRTPRNAGVSPLVSRQLAALLEMPDVHTSQHDNIYDRSGADTPHSILKRREALNRDAPSPVDSRYLGDSDDEILETVSNHTHYSDSTNKHLRFTIPTASESGSTPSPPSPAIHAALERERERSISQVREKEIAKSIAEEKEMDISVAAERDMDMSIDSFATTTSHALYDPNPLESPPKKQATEYKVPIRKSYKDTVRARRSLSISANSSLSDDPNTSIESIADIPITLINPRYSGNKRQKNIDTLLHLIDNQSVDTTDESMIEIEDTSDADEKETETVGEVNVVVPQTPKGRKGIRSIGESTTFTNRSRSVTPERPASPVVTPLHTSRITRSRSRTPELSPRSSPLPSIPEQPKQEVETEPHPERTLLSVPRLRSRSRTPECIDKSVKVSPKLEVITESPTKSSSTDSPSSSPSRRSLRSRSRTPEVELLQEKTAVKASPRSLRSRSKTPEKLMSPKKDLGRSKKSLSRIVLEMNAFAKNKETLEKFEQENAETLAKVEQEDTAEKTDSAIKCTPMKTYKPVHGLMDVTLSPIVNKSVLQSSTDSVQSDTDKTDDMSTTELGIKPLPTFTTIHDTYIDKSVLHSYESSMEVTSSIHETNKVDNDYILKLPAFTTINETGFEKSVLHSYVSSSAECSIRTETEYKSEKTVSKPFAAFAAMIETDFEKSVLHNYQSSVAETSQEASITEDKSTQNASIMTNDSDVETKNTQWQADDSQDTAAAVIQKEKEKIVEIEREINEIEGDMSDDAEDSESSNESGSANSSVESSTSESDEEIISIKDTDSEDSTSSGNELHFDEDTSQDRPTEENVENIHVQVEKVGERVPEIQVTTSAPDTNEDPLDHGQISILTDDNSMVESDKSDVNLNYSDEKENEVDKDSGKKDKVPTETVINIIVEEVPTEMPIEEPMPLDNTTFAKGVDVVDAIRTDNPVIETETKNTKEREDKPQINKAEPQPEIKEVDSIKSNEPVETVAQEEAKVTEVTDKEIEVTANIEKKVEKPGPRSRKRVKSTSSNKSTKEPETEVIEELKTPITRKRTQSNTSNKSVAETEQETPENKTETRKRTQSNASNKSVAETEQKTPENKNETSTPTRRRAKTPTSAEVRKIITRRMSREMSEKDETVEELTPKRRSARSSSKNIDDNESVASEISVNKSKARENADVKPAPIRKGRKSILATKPELSVIPEMLAEEGAKGDSNVEYSSPRLTRNQKSIIESWLESPAGRRTSTTSISELSHDDDASTHSTFDVQPIDRITLLNKTDFQGTPDKEELQNFSPESIASDASKQRRSRLGRAVSEARAMPKAAKITRRTSVDVGPSSPGLGEQDTPTRSRRASFNRACEALHTPKGRRPSTDQMIGEVDSPVNSPAGSESASTSAVTPSRRPRRASTQSNSSLTKSDIGKRAKKMPVIEESNDIKKK